MRTLLLHPFMFFESQLIARHSNIRTRRMKNTIILVSAIGFQSLYEDVSSGPLGGRQAEESRSDETSV